MPVLGLPLLLVGLAALPMVAGIYWLRTRFRRQEVSTLFLWQSAVDAQGGGRKKSRLQTPLTLLLELLAIVLLVLAATAPRVLRAGQTVAVTVVLDDSYSMRAIDERGVDSRERAIETLREELHGLPRYTARLISAGAEPQVLGEPVSDWAGVEKILTGYRCEAPTSDIGGALALASEIGGPRGRLLVLSDHPMPENMRSRVEATSMIAEQATPDASAEEEAVWGRLRWRAVGQPGNNVALIHAVRSLDADRGDTVLIELMNHWATTARPSLTLSVGTAEADYTADPSSHAVGESLIEVDQRQVELLPGRVKRLWLRPSEAAGRPVVVRLEEDALNADNRVVLMPIESRPLGVSVELEDPALRRAVTQAVEASGNAVVVSEGAGLVFTDRLTEVDATPRGGAWMVRFDRGDGSVGTKEAQAFLGPFVIDRSHPLAEGLSLTGLVWSVASPEVSPTEPPSAAAEPLGRPIVTAGNEVLLSDEARRGAGHVLTWRLWPERSTVLQSAAFPILVWNIIEWRRADRPGVSPVNARPGVPISITTAAAQGEVRVRWVQDGGAARGARVEEDGKEDVLSVVDRRVVYSPKEPGVYEIQADDRRYRLAVNGGSEAESDLRGAGADDFGRWDDRVAIEREYQGLSWALGLFALGLLASHAWWLGRAGRSSLAGIHSARPAQPETVSVAGGRS
ncbi:MAG: VWA domain-containing protein [Planctomycetota bacterium]